MGPALKATWPGHYLGNRWRGQVPWPRLFWRDMLGIGTVVNLGVSFAALIWMTLGAELWVAVVLHFSPLPFNLFLFLALLRTPGRPAVCAAAAAGWVVLMAIV